MERLNLDDITETASYQTLVQTFNLSPFETALLHLCVLAAIDEEMVDKLLELHGKPYPTFALAMRLLEGAHGDALAPQRPLRHWNLIEIIHPPELPYTLGALRINERILHYIQGYDHLDERLQAYLFGLKGEPNQPSLPPSQMVITSDIVALVQDHTEQTPLPIIQLTSIDAESKQALIQNVVSELGIQLYHLPAELIPKPSHELDLFARLWARECALSGVALYIDAHELDGETNGEQIKQTHRFLTRSGGLFFLSTRTLWNDLDLPVMTFDVAKPTTAEQESLWRDQLGEAAEPIIKQLVAQFDLNGKAISRAGKAIHGESATLSSVWDACLVETRPQLDFLATAIIPKASWDDIVLPVWQVEQLQEVAAQVKNRGVVHEQWGWREQMSRGLGMTVLFGGDSGTGKTFAAEILAKQLNLNLYHIDLSQVVSKYIGETEKNLRKLFDAAESGGAILFFDEADALFSKRSETRSSNDRYANMETNYLLQRLEQYQGLAILTTNLLNNIDEAFLRRVRFIVQFPMPEDDDRARIWQRIFPSDTPLGELDYSHLSRFKMSGGSIYNAALNASFRAARRGGCVEMPDILEMIRLELNKIGRLPQPRMFVWPQ